MAETLKHGHDTPAVPPPPPGNDVNPRARSTPAIRSSQAPSPPSASPNVDGIGRKIAPGWQGYNAKSTNSQLRFVFHASICFVGFSLACCLPAYFCHGSVSVGSSQREFHSRSRRSFDVTAAEHPMFGLQQQSSLQASQRQWPTTALRCERPGPSARS